AHASRVDIELNGWTAPCQYVSLEIRRNVDGEGVKPRIHARVHLSLGDHSRREKVRGIEGRGDARGKGGVVLVNNRNRGSIECLRKGCCCGVNRNCEGEDNEAEHQGIAAETAQLFDAQDRKSVV